MVSMIPSQYNPSPTMKEFLACLGAFSAIMILCLLFLGCGGRKADKCCSIPCGKCPNGAVCCKNQCPGSACKCLK